MPKFLIEVPHEEEPVACAQAVQFFLTSGSHFLANADWGCLDGEHKAWMIVDVPTREDAQGIVPPSFREGARIVRLNRFEMDDVDEVLRQHQG
ncbi:MAG: hypothetical protein ACK2UC_03315 [Anaerolineae bacterium]|jgi:hypothetical protein